MQFVISYDITNNKMRKKACQLLKDYGRRVQYSVFECNLEATELNELLKKAGTLLNGPKDSLRVYNLCRHCCSTAIRLERTQGKRLKNTAGEALRKTMGIEEPPRFVVI